MNLGGAYWSSDSPNLIFVYPQLDPVGPITSTPTGPMAATVTVHAANGDQNAATCDWDDVNGWWQCSFPGDLVIDDGVSTLVFTDPAGIVWSPPLTQGPTWTANISIQ